MREREREGGKCVKLCRFNSLLCLRKARVELPQKWNRIAIAYYYENYIIQTFKLAFHAKKLPKLFAFYKSDLIKIAVASHSRMNN